MNNVNEQPATLRFGHVTEYDPNLHAARVNFPDRGIVSHWLPVLTVNTLRNHDEVHLDPGEHVVCLLAGNGAESGVILGAFFDRKNTPPVRNADKRSHTFSDDTQIVYDREAHQLKIECAGDIDIHAKGNITLKADGNITEQGSRIDLN